MTLIEKLYHGMIRPSEHIVQKKEEYRSLIMKIGIEKAYFTGIMQEANRERFRNFNNLLNRYEGMCEYANFESGFRWGFKLAQEIFNSETEQTDVLQNEPDMELLDILIKKRTEAELDERVKKDPNWIKDKEMQGKAEKLMDDMIKSMGFTHEQVNTYHRVLDAGNAVSAAHSEVAYKLELSDGIKLLFEMKAMKS